MRKKDIRIPNSAPQRIVHFKRGSTKDIMKIVMEVVNKDDLTYQVSDFAQAFKGSNDDDQYRKLKQLWRWVRDNITYVADGGDLQMIQHPARLVQSGIGDCKSFTVFVHFVLKALCIRNVIRFISQNNDQRIDHVYNVAYIGDREVIIDTVYDRFDREPPLKTRAIDKTPKNYCVVSRTSSNAIGNVQPTTPRGLWLGLGFLAALLLLSRD
ncbi:MAG: transglutaminase-like domain-containing protein [Bacteroidota bacterium]